MRFVKTNIPNLVKLEPIGTYYGRCKVGGKLVRLSLETREFKIAKQKLPDWLQKVRGGLNTKDGLMASLVEAYQRRLKLAVAGKDIRERTRATKLECLSQIEKVWDEFFDTGNVNPANYRPGGNGKLRPTNKSKLFRKVRLSSLTEERLEEWRAAMIQAYSPTRVNGAMTVFRELLELAVRRGLLYRNHDLSGKLKYVKVGQSRLSHLPSVEKFRALVMEVYHRAAKGQSVFANGRDDSGELFEFLAYSGARIKSANHVTWEDVDWERNQLHFRVTKRDEYRIPLFPELSELLTRLQKKHAGKPTGRIFKVKSIKRVLRSACVAVDTPVLTQHDLRHFFATRCIEAGTDIPTVSRWLGHKDGGALAMKTYGHLRDEHSQGAAKLVQFK